MARRRLESEERFVDKVLDIEHAEKKMLWADVDPRKFFPSGKEAYPSQDESLQETQEFYKSPTERLMAKIIPTAGGKSPDAAASALAWTAAGGVSVIICPNKELQQQYKKDFGAGDLSIVTGAVEYSCNVFPGLSCASSKARKTCPDRRVKKDGAVTPQCACPYRTNLFQAAANARKKPLCFTPHSYDAFKKNSLVADSLPRGDGLMIIDEAHLLEDQLRDFLSVSLRVDMIDGLLDFDEELGGFANEFFFESQGVLNDENERVALVKPNQALYLQAINEAIELRVNRMVQLLREHDAESLSLEFSFLSDSNDADRFEKHLEVLAKISSKLKFILSTLQETHWVVELTRSTTAAEDLEKEEPQAPQSPATGESASKGFVQTQARDGEEAAPQLPLRLLLRPTVIPSTYLKEFFRGFSKVILMSGTLFGLHMKLLGLAPRDAENPFSECRLFQTGSRINVNRRKIVIDIINGKDVSSRGGKVEEAFRHFADYVVNRVVPKLPGEKGIIHVSSKKQAELFCRLANDLARSMAAEDGGRLCAEFITPGRRLSWNEAFRRFKEREVGGANLFLVAARRYEGIDLAGDLARICLMLKAPYPNTKDTMITALEHVFPGYTATTTLVSFIQGMNRAVRGPTDWALNICLDTLSAKLMQQYGSELPEHVQDQIEVPEFGDWLEQWRIPDEKARSERRKSTKSGGKASAKGHKGGPGSGGGAGGGFII